METAGWIIAGAHGPSSGCGRCPICHDGGRNFDLAASESRQSPRELQFRTLMDSPLPVRDPRVSIVPMLTTVAATELLHAGVAQWLFEVMNSPFSGASAKFSDSLSSLTICWS
jgi:hypothetical protein